jgi:hypothetical protein
MEASVKKNISTRCRRNGIITGRLKENIRIERMPHYDSFKG